MSDRIKLPRPLSHQLVIHGSDARFKVARKGRRWGKTTWAFLSAMDGHGPGWEKHEPMFPGVLQGWDVVWVGKSNPQLKQIWAEGVEPRLRGVDNVILNIADHTAKIADKGTLHIRSAESIDSLRGLGSRVKGIILDETAWLDFDYAWKSVLRPMLVDNVGWAIIMSTTNCGSDGGKDEETGLLITPSGFNRLCKDVMEGVAGRTREDGWAHFYGIASDNPKLDPTEFRAFVREYAEGSFAREQEVYANLLTTGVGFAFPEWRADVHVAKYDPPPDWSWFVGVDWGYNDPCVAIILAAGAEDVLARSEMTVRKTPPYEAGYQLGQKLNRLPGRAEYVACGDDMCRVTDGGPTIYEEFSRGVRDATQPNPIPCTTVARGAGSRLAGKMIVHQHLRTKGDFEGKPVPIWAGPKLRFHPDCVELIQTLPKLPVCPLNSEDVDKRAPEHHYEALRYALVSRYPHPQATSPGTPLNVHPGFMKVGDGWRRRPRDPEERRMLEEEAARAIRPGYHFPSYGYGLARPVEDDAA